MVNNIPLGWCNKAGGSRGLSLARQTQSAEVNGAEQKMSTQGAVPVFFSRNVIRNVNFYFSVLCLSGKKFFRRPFKEHNRHNFRLNLQEIALSLAKQSRTL